MKPFHGVMFSALLLSGVMSVAQQQQPSLGDVARQPKPNKKATRVITNDDIPSRPQQDAASSHSSGAAVTSADAPKPGEAPAEEKDNAEAAKPGKEDSAEVAAMKQRLKELDSDEENLTTSLSRAEGLANSADDEERREVFEHIMAKKRESLQRTKAERAEINQKLAEQKKPEEKKPEEK
jgi:hypothetical protein